MCAPTFVSPSLSHISGVKLCIFTYIAWDLLLYCRAPVSYCRATRSSNVFLHHGARVYLSTCESIHLSCYTLTDVVDTPTALVSLLISSFISRCILSGEIWRASRSI